MDVTRNTFAKALPLVEKALERCQFYSFDLEMTGLHVVDKREEYLDDIQDRYEALAEGAQNFLVSQFGLSFFCWEGGKYEAQTFNFYLFPLPMLHGQDKRFLCQAGSLEFLAGQGFDFNKFVYEGIPFMRAADRDRRLANLNREPARNEISIHKPKDVDFVNSLVQQVSSWLKGNETELVLEEVNGYQRAIQYQQLEKAQFGAAEPPGFYFEAADGPQGKRAIRLTRASATEVAAFHEQKKQGELERVHAAAGFCAVLERLRDSGRPAVGHNCAFDLTFTLEHLAQPLPPDWAAFKRLARDWFPGGLWDTKYLIKQLPQLCDMLPSTSLQPLYQALNPGGTPQPEVMDFLNATGGRLPRVEHAAAFARYTGPDADSHAHEAGYDAFMTGAVFACLLQLHSTRLAGAPATQGGTEAAGVSRSGAPEAGALSARGLVAEIEHASFSGEQPHFSGVQEYMGRVHLMFSPIPYASIYGEDPVPDLDHVFYLSGITPGTRQSDLNRVLESAGLGRIRINQKSRGTQAIAELLDRGASPEAVKHALCSVLNLSRDQVLTAAEFAAQKASGQLAKLPHGGWAAAAEQPPAFGAFRTGEANGDGAGRPVKRLRADEDVTMAPVEEAEPSAARSKRCVIM